MAAEDQIIKGRDARIRITLRDENQVVIPLDSLQGYVAHLYYPHTNHVLERFSKNTLAGHKGVIEIDVPNGVFDILLQASKTDNAQVGELLAEALIQDEDTDFDDNFKQTGVRDKIVGTIVGSTANDLTNIS